MTDILLETNIFSISKKMNREPKYGVINPNPTVKDIYKNLNGKDLLQLLGLTFGCAALGYMSGIIIYI